MNLRTIYWRWCDVRNGLRGIWYWLPFAWGWRSWDWQYGLNALEHHLRASEPVIRNGIHVDAEKYAKQMRVAIELLRRIREDDYADRMLAGEITTKRYGELANRDWAMLFEHLRKYMGGWWE